MSTPAVPAATSAPAASSASAAASASSPPTNDPPAPARPPPPPPVDQWAALRKPEEFVLLGTIVGYLAGNPFYYRIQPDRVNGVQPPDVHAENPLRGRILPLRRRVGYVLDEHSGPPSAPGLVAIVGIWGFWGPTLEQLRAEFAPPPF